MPTDVPLGGERGDGSLPANQPRVGDAVEERARRLVADLDPPGDPRVARELLEGALGLLADDPDPLDLKIAAAAMTEMREAFMVFAPYRHIPKVTVFGSARTEAHDPVYEQARRIAEALATRGWMVVTGAGPGIMQAAMEGAGRARSIGVAIRLPFEQGANPVIAGDEKYVSMKYFFTRKLMLVKESRAFVCLPGGFGTLDETFELLTLTQTGKGLPVPIVLLDPPHDPFWKRIDEMIHELLVSRNLVSPSDTKLYVVTDSVEEACAEIDRFYANYHSIRYVGDQAVIRLRHEPSDEVLAELNADFRHLVARGRFARTGPLDIERRHDDHVDLPRVRFSFVKHRASDLRSLIDRLNRDVAPMPGAGAVEIRPWRAPRRLSPRRPDGAGEPPSRRRGGPGRASCRRPAAPPGRRRRPVAAARTTARRAPHRRPPTARPARRTGSQVQCLGDDVDRVPDVEPGGRQVHDATGIGAGDGRGPGTLGGPGDRRQLAVADHPRQRRLQRGVCAAGPTAEALVVELDDVRHVARARAAPRRGSAGRGGGGTGPGR